MNLFKGLTQEEFKELRSNIIFIGLMMYYKRDWREYISKSKPIIANLANQSDSDMDLIIQGVLNEHY